MKNLPRFILLLSLLFTFSFTQAQEYHIGVKGGINYNTIGDLFHYGEIHGFGGDLTPDEDMTYTADKGIGNHYGIYVTADFGRFFIRPEINFTSMKNSYALAFNTTDWTSTKIEIPILIGINIYKPVSIYAGPVFSSISDREIEGLKLQNGVPETPLTFDKNATGINAGVLIQYKRFGLDLRYEYGITSVKTQRIKMIRATYGTFVADLKEYNPSQISMSLTIDLLHFSIGNRNSGSGSRYDWRNHKNCPVLK
ncbi:MAG: outer membrane beta-barrel protein [Flavobacteriaceae bacterium]|nr:outer membrane beta-barrel protein [Flavobacteriaceae bacterium]